jgi:hypothetical protein
MTISRIRPVNTAGAAASLSAGVWTLPHRPARRSVPADSVQLAKVASGRSFADDVATAHRTSRRHRIGQCGALEVLAAIDQGRVGRRIHRGDRITHLFEIL